MTQPYIRVAVVAYKSERVLPDCLEAIAIQSFSDFEVVIVNNDCPENCTDGLVLPDSRFSVVDAGKNLGFAGGSNFALLNASSSWVATINPDARLAPDVFEKLHHAAKLYPDCSMVSPVLVQDAEPEVIDGAGDVMSIWGVAWQGGHGADLKQVPDQFCEVFCPSGATAFYRTDVFLGANGFDEDLFCYVEDTDLGLRLRAQGEKCVLVPAMRVRHIGSSTLGKQHDFIWYQSYRNNVIVLLKSLPLSLLFLVFPIHVLSRIWLIWRNRHKIGHSSRVKGFTSGLGAFRGALKKRKKANKPRSSYIWRWLEPSPKAMRETRLRFRRMKVRDARLADE